MEAAMHNTNDGTTPYAQQAGAPSRSAHWPELDFAAGSPTWAPLQIGGAGYHAALREFVLPYDEVRLANSPDALLLDFLQGSYDAAARLGRWDRAALERGPAPAGA
jgi:hypothetical protein